MILKEIFVALVRHGWTKYTQGNGESELSSACDLHFSSRQSFPPFTLPSDRMSEIDIGRKLRSMINHLLHDREINRPIRIISSPTGRCLSTAKVIRSCIQRRDNLSLAKKNGLELYGESGIESDRAWGENRNFEWSIFEPLVKGGKIKHDDKEPFVIDAADSNPNGIDPLDYLDYNLIHSLPSSVTRKWPRWYVKRIRSFETPEERRKRLERNLRQIANKPNADRFLWIVVTHAGIVAPLLRHYTDNRIRELPRGEWLLFHGIGEYFRLLGMSSSLQAPTFSSF